MAELGRTNTLTVLKQVDFGFYLDGGDLGEILLPMRYAPIGLKDDDKLEVFLYLDSEDRPIATTETPYVQVGECAHLRVKDVGEFGAFLDWGLMKDLFVPFKEMRIPMLVGKSYMVCVFIDATERIAASSKLSDFLYEENDGAFEPGEKVTLQIATRSDLGYKAIIGGNYLGLLHSNEIFQPIQVGETLTGFVKSIRPDGRINLTLQHKGQESRDTVAERVMEYLNAHGGITQLTDKSPPEQIYAEVGVSKAAYKKALGKLFKEKRVLLEPDRVSLLPNAGNAE